MTHKCFQCEKRFESSAQLVKHMQEAHSTFVKDAKDKIDRSKEQYSRSFANTAATCPYCKVDCHTRKKLMRHLDEHKDLEPEEETELKIIRITNESKSSLLNHFDGDKPGAATVAASSDGNPTFVQNLIRAIEGDPTKIGNSKIKVSSTSLKLPERRYKCFWCDTSFRKRGKLMDHIDMFHKANKDQSELEAVLLQGASMPQENTKSKPAAVKHSNSSSTSSHYSDSKNGGKETIITRSKSCDKPVSSQAKQKKQTCSFSVAGSIRESSKVVPKEKAVEKLFVCKFYFGNSGASSVETQQSPKDLESKISPAVPSTEPSVLAASFSPSHFRQLRSTSMSSNNSLPLSSPQTNVPPSRQAPTHPFGHAPQMPIQSHPLSQSVFPHMPYYVPASDLYLNQQHNLLMEQQRSQLQYLSYMQSLASQSAAIDPNRPLDLSKGK